MTLNIIKHAGWDLSDMADKARSAVGRGASSVADWYRNMDPNTKKNVLHGLLGAGTGMTLMGINHAISKRDPDEQGGLGRAIGMGGILGGVAGAGIPMGLRILRGEHQFKNEPGSNMVGRTLDTAANIMADHPGASIGGIVGGLRKARENKGLIGGLTMSGPSHETLSKLISDLPPAEKHTVMQAWKTINPQSQKYPDLSGAQRRALYNQLGQTNQYWVKGVKSKLSRDPRARVLAAILATGAAGHVIQKAITGSI